MEETFGGVGWGLVGEAGGGACCCAVSPAWCIYLQGGSRRGVGCDGASTGSVARSPRDAEAAVAGLIVIPWENCKMSLIVLSNPPPTPSRWNCIKPFEEETRGAKYRTCVWETEAAESKQHAGPMCVLALVASDGKRTFSDVLLWLSHLPYASWDIVVKSQNPEQIHILGRW